MAQPNFQRLQELFTRARQLPIEERDSFLAQACGSNKKLREAVEELLDHDNSDLIHNAPLPLTHPLAEAFQDQTATSEGGDSELPKETQIGPYKLIKKIGQGGMGAVFLAEQEKPVRRQVALKLIRRGRTDKRILSRFEAERQALAMMDHANIARILDAGTTDDGAPYFVMELVDGVPISNYCDQNQLSAHQRLELFIPVCNAVQHAHQKGIIHRDLKPSNVLVATQDGKPLVKVIDFGLAKALQPQLKLTEETMNTEFGQIMGTLQYMSPEQAGANEEDVDTRADIYALGSILYKLLTGFTPIDDDSLRQKALDEVYRMIREQDPPRPSKRLTDSGTESGIAGSNSQSWRNSLRNELDWIVMCAIHKNRDQRYETVAALADDVRNYLNGDSVIARPPSKYYQVRKFIKKHRLGLAFAGAIATLLLTTTLVSVFSYMQINSLLSAEKEANIRINDLLSAEKVAKQEADRSAKRNQRIVDVFVGAFRSADLDNESVSSDFRAVDVLKQALSRVQEHDFTDDPIAKSKLTHAIGSSLHSIGEFDLAVTALEEGIASGFSGDNPSRDLMALKNDLVLSYAASGEFDKAIELGNRVVNLATDRLGTEDYLTIRAMGNLSRSYLDVGDFDTALSLAKQAFRLSAKHQGEDHRSTLDLMGNLAWIYHELRQDKKAIEINTEVLSKYRSLLGELHPATLTAMNNQAVFRDSSGDDATAIESREELVRLMKNKLGENHPQTLTGLNNLALAYYSIGNYDKAIEIGEPVYKLRLAKLGKQHLRTFFSMVNLIDYYVSAGRRDDALDLLDESDSLIDNVLSSKISGAHKRLMGLGASCRKLGRYPRAIEILEQTLAFIRREYQQDHPDALTAQAMLALAYQYAGRIEEAVELGEELLEMRKAKLGERHPSTLVSMNNLARAYKFSGRLKESAELGEDGLRLMREVLGSDHPNTLTRFDNFQDTLMRMKRFAQAEVNAREWLEVLESSKTPKLAKVAAAYTSLAACLAGLKKSKEATEAATSAMAIKDIHPLAYFRTQSVAGYCLALEENFEEAEPMLLNAHNQLVARIDNQGSYTWYVDRTFERIIDMYEMSNNPEKVGEWEKKRANFQASTKP